MSLSGMTLFELSRRPPIIITVCHAKMLYCVLDDNISPENFMVLLIEYQASSPLLYYDVGVSGWHWEQLAS